MACYICEYVLVNKVALMDQPKQTEKVKKKNIISSFQQCRMNEDFITTSHRHSDSLCVSPRHTYKVPSQWRQCSPPAEQRSDVHTVTGWPSSYRRTAQRFRTQSLPSSSCQVRHYADITAETADIITDMTDSRRQQPHGKHLAAEREADQSQSRSAKYRYKSLTKVIF